MTALILIVDDDTSLREMIAFVLGQEGYQITQAADGEEAIALIEQGTTLGNPYDIVVTDIVMGTTSGVAVTEHARRQPDPADVILLTSYGKLETALAAIDAGARGYLLKPINWNELKQRIATTLEQRQEQQRYRAQAAAWQRMSSLLNETQTHLDDLLVNQEDPEHEPDTSPQAQTAPRTTERLQVGPLRLETQTRQVQYHGRGVRVTPIEFAILTCLVEVPGKVVSYGAIVRRTHGSAIDERDSYELLRTHVRNLRRKLEPQVIINVRGIGYLLDLTLHGQSSTITHPDDEEAD